MMITALAVPTTAFAQVDGYNEVAGTQGGGGPTPVAETQSVATTSDAGGESLPFTGLELSLMLGAGVVLLGTGLLLRRARTE